MEHYKEALHDFFTDVLTNGTEDEQQILFLTKQAIEHMRRKKTAYLSGFLGLSGELLEDGTYRFEVPITPFMLNGHKIVHGGMSATLADSTMGSLVSRTTGSKVVTTEMKVNYISPGVGEKLISTATLLKKGNRLCVCECKIHNEKGALVLAATGTFYLLGS